MIKSKLSVRWSVAMRWLVLAVLTFGAMSGARAADLSDLPILRGGFTEGLSSSRARWDGWYGGGQVTYSSSSMDFSNSITGLTNFMFRNSVLSDPLSKWTLLGTAAPQSTGFGAFAGRNFQIEDLVLGVEVNYKYINGLAGSSSSSMSRGIVNPTGANPPAGHTYTYNVTVTGNAAAQIKDAITFRGRAGWAADCFLPYVFGGLAVGRMDISRSASAVYDLQDDFDQTIGGVTTHQRQFTSFPALSENERRTNDFVFGWTAGLGLEYALLGNLFVRGEWEYMSFLTVKNTAISTN